MISFDQARKACNRLNIPLSDHQLNNLLLELLPNPQSGFGVGGVNVWGDEKSITQIQRWHHAHSVTDQWRRQVDSNQQRAIRAEEMGIKLLDFILSISACNPAAVGHVRKANELLDDLDIEPREGFYHNPEIALADARTKFYAAVHPR